MKNVRNEIEECKLKKRREYLKDYRKNNADKVEQWRKNAVVKAYIRLVKAEPNYFVEREDL